MPEFLQRDGVHMPRDRWLIHNHPFTCFVLRGHLAEHLVRRASLRLLRKALCQLPFVRIGDETFHLLDINLQVKTLHRRQLHQSGQRILISDDGGAGRLRTLLLGESRVPSADMHTGGETLEVPLPGCDGALVAIVEVEEQRTFGGGKETKIRDMGIAAGYDAQVSGGAGREVVGHRVGGAAVIREWRLQYPSHPNRNEILKAAGVLLDENSDGVAIIGQGKDLLITTAKSMPEFVAIGAQVEGAGGGKTRGGNCGESGRAQTFSGTCASRRFCRKLGCLSIAGPLHRLSW